MANILGLIAAPWDDTVSLLQTVNSQSTGTLNAPLAADITSGATTITATVTGNKGGYPAASGVISIDDEIVYYATASVSAGTVTFSGCLRGQDGTTAAAHTVASGALVYGFAVRAHYSVLRDAQLAVEGALRGGLGSAGWLHLNVLSPTYGAVGDGTTNDATAINAAITDAYNAGGGTVVLPPGKTYAISASILAKNNVTLSHVGADIKWVGAAGGTMITSATADPIMRFRHVGGRLNPNTTNGAAYCWNLHSPQFCYFDCEVLDGLTTLIVLRIAADATNASGYNGTRNPVWNTVQRLLAAQCATLLRLDGQSTGAITLNTFHDLWCDKNYGTGIIFGSAGYIDTNRFDHVYIHLRANNLIGIDMGETNTATNIYNHDFSKVSVDAAAGTTGCTAIALRISAKTTIASFYNGSDAPFSTVIDTSGPPDSYYIANTRAAGGPNINVTAHNFKLTNPNAASTGQLTIDNAYLTYPLHYRTSLYDETLGSSVAPFLTAKSGVIAARNTGDSANVPLEALLHDKGGAVYHVEAYGAKADVKVVTDAVTTAAGTTVSSTQAAFTSADNGKQITIAGAGTAGALYNGTINSVTAGVATLSAATPTAVSGATAKYGTDNQSAITSAIAAAGTNGVVQFAPGGQYAIRTSLLLTNGVLLSGLKSTLYWLGAAGGTIITNALADPVQLAGVEIGKIDPGGATYGLYLHSPQYCYFDVEFLDGTTAFVGMTMRADATNSSGYNGTRNAVFNYTRRLFTNQAATCLWLEGPGSSPGVGTGTCTLNYFGQVIGFACYSTGFVCGANGYVDTNTFTYMYIYLRANNQIGVDLGQNNTATNVYNTWVHSIAIDAFGLTGCTGFMLRKSAKTQVLNFYPGSETPFTNIIDSSGPPDSYMIADTRSGGGPAINIYAKNWTQTAAAIGDITYTKPYLVNPLFFKPSFYDAGSPGGAYNQVYSWNGTLWVRDVTDSFFQPIRSLGLNFGAQPASTYGLDLVGGSARLVQSSVPAIPTITQGGTPGSTVYTYYVVGVDRNGNKTLPSPVARTVAGNATLNGTNFNTITWAIPTGCVSVDVIRASSAGTPATTGSIALASTATTLNDTGLTASAYTAPTRNATNDLTIDGILGIGTTAPAYGLHLYGAGARLQALASPGTPTVTPTGGTATTWAYYVVGKDELGNVTLASAIGQTTTGAATLDATHFNTVAWSGGANTVSYDLIRSTAGTSPNTTGLIAQNLTATSFVDTGYAIISAYTTPARNTTADLTVDGNALLSAMANPAEHVAFTATANKPSTTTAQTVSMVGTGVGTMTLPANFLVAGRSFRLRARGYMTTGATAGTLNWLFQIGGSTIVSTGAVAPTISLTSLYWECEVTVTCRTIGTSGTVIAEGRVLIPTSATTTATWGMVETAASTVDTTAAKLVDLQLTTSNALHTITCTNVDLTILN